MTEDALDNERALVTAFVRKPENIFQTLRSRGAGELSTLKSCRQLRPIPKKLKKRSSAKEWEAFLSCLPGRIAYFEGEDTRCILERAKAK